MIYLINDSYPQEISIPRSFGVIVPRRTEYLTQDDIAADLETDSDREVLAASQGVRLKELIDEKADVNQIPTKTSQLQNDSNFVTASQVSRNFETKQEAIAMEVGLREDINGKQDIINDLQTIREGAALGATAYQKPDTGIPASDLAEGVIPTIHVEDVKVGGTSVVTNNIAEIPAIPDAVEANPVIPSGTTPPDLEHLKVGDDYFAIPQGSEVDLSTDVVADRNSNAKASTPKSVADALGKWGVVSQTQTWTGSNATGYDYTMSNLVYGLIPQANIDLYVAAGAVFNEATGYFELNGLTDISYAEMRNIYEYGKITIPLTRYKYSYLLIRTTLPQNDVYFNFASASDFSGGFLQTDVEVIRFGKETSPSSTNVPVLSNSQSTFTSFKIKDAGTMKLTQTGAITIPCVSLERIHIFSLNADITFRSSRLGLESIVFLVNNAGNGTKSVIVTLHATAYARCQADTTEYTYQGNTYTGILAYASAKNITIASA